MTLPISLNLQPIDVSRITGIFDEVAAFQAQIKAGLASLRGPIDATTIPAKAVAVANLINGLISLVGGNVPPLTAPDILAAHTANQAISTDPLGAPPPPPPPETAKYALWQRLATPGIIPGNDQLHAMLFVAGDTIYSDADPANAITAEFYLVTPGSFGVGIAPSPTGRAAFKVGLVG